MTHAQIETDKPDRNPVPTVPRNRKQRRSRSGPPFPRELRKEIAAFARKLKRDHKALFASDPVYKKRAGQFLTSLLPPKQRRRGRPGRPDVTKAIRLLKRFKREHPDERPSQHWARMYPLVILGYAAMNAVEQRDARERLRERVRWRLRYTSVATASAGRTSPAKYPRRQIRALG
jgi:hypothetical protein